jgi:hypothetical protein
MSSKSEKGRTTWSGSLVGGKQNLRAGYKKEARKAPAQPPRRPFKN